MTAPNIIFPARPLGDTNAIDTIAELRALDSTDVNDNTNIIVANAGVYKWNSASTAADDGGLVVKPDDKTSLQAGRWLQILIGSDTQSFVQEGTGSEERSVQSKLRETLSVTDFIPAVLHASIRDGTNIINLTAYIQAALDAATSGDTLRFPRGVYLVTGDLQFKGGIRYIGTLGTIVKLIDGSACKGVFVSKHYYTADQPTFQAEQSLYKFRPVFEHLAIDGNLAGGATGSGIVLITSEAKVQFCRIINCSEYAVELTCFNQHGQTSNSGSNFLQNYVCDNRLSGSGKGGVKSDGTGSRTTDGWVCRNSITNGSDYAIRIEEAQGWQITENQTSSTFGAIILGKTNHTIVSDNVINAFGNKDTFGARYGIHLGGLTTTHAQVTCEGNTIEANYNATAAADSSSIWVLIGFYGVTEGTTGKGIVIGGNQGRFSGFSGTTDKTRFIRQTNNDSDDINGTITGNTVNSDQGSDDAMTDTCIEVHQDNQCEITLNKNGPYQAVVFGRFHDRILWHGRKKDVPSGLTVISKLFYTTQMHGEIRVNVSVGPNDFQGYAQYSTEALVLVRAFDSNDPPTIGTPLVLHTEDNGTISSGTRDLTTPVVTVTTPADGEIEINVNTTTSGDSGVLLNFDSGGAHQILAGETVEGATSGATGVVASVDLETGTWAGGDAAGTLVLNAVTGTFQNNEALDVTAVDLTVHANSATADGTQILPPYIADFDVTWRGRGLTRYTT